MKSAAWMTYTALSILLAPVAIAQQTTTRSSEDIQEVTVTAQRREQNLQDVPIAVSAFDSAELERRQITRTLDLISFVPNMIGHNNTGLGTANAYSIRALNNTESIATFDPPVGTYVDEVFIARQNANNFEFFDVDRIEVLRGPQGTLFGRNTTGGAINVFMKKPTAARNGFAELGLGEYDRKQGRASIDLPITEKVLTKLSGFYVEDNGYLHNRTTGEKLNDEQTWGARAALRVLFTDAVTWDTSIDYIDSSISNLVHFIQDGDRINFTRQRSGVGLGPAFVSSDLADIGLGNNTKSGAFISNVQWALNDRLTLNFITGVRQLDQQFMTESFDSLNSATVVFNDHDFVSGSPGTATPLVNDGWHRQYTQEIKLTSAAGGKLDYVAGIFYFDDENRTSFANINIPLTGPATVTQDRTMENGTRSIAGYAQGDIHWTDRFTTTLGVRYTDDSKDITFTPNDNPLTRLFPPFDNNDLIAFGIPTHIDEAVWTPRVAVEFKATQDVMLFASATKGFKTGGWNARANAGRLALDFASEKEWSYEAGARTEWFDHRLRLNVNAFFMDVEDFQLPAGYADPTTGVINYLTRNFAGLENYGFEAEVTWMPSERWNLFWAGGTQKAKYVDVNPSVLAQQQDCQNRLATGQVTTNICNVSIITPTGEIAEPVRAPHFTSTLGISGSFPLSANLNLAPSINWSYVDESWAATANTPIGLQHAHSSFNGGITLRDPDGPWSVTAECTNCSDEDYVTSYLVYPYLNEPRRWQVRARFNF